MDKVFVGKIVNTHGIKGEFRIKSDFELKSRIFVVGNTVIINDAPYKIASYRVHKNYDMITLDGYDNINDVLEFKGKNIYINRDDLALKDEEYIFDDLLGANVLIGDDVIGVVKDYFSGANPLLEISAEKRFYIPLRGNFIVRFDKRDKKLIVSEDVRGLL